MKGCISQRAFNKYLDGSMDQKSRKVLEDHIKRCDACRKEFEAWNAVKADLEAASGIPAPEGFKERVMARVSKERVKPAAVVGSVRKGLALAFISVIILYYITRPILGSLVDKLFMDVFRALSENLYAFLGLIGIDPAVPIKLFGSFIANFNDFLPVFASGTILMIIGFIILITKMEVRSEK